MHCKRRWSALGAYDKYVSKEEARLLRSVFDQIPNENVKALKESFAYHYRNEAETKGRLKYSVSEIKRMSQAADTEEVMYSSVFMEKEKMMVSFFLSP